LLVCPLDRGAIDEALPGLLARYSQAQHIEVVDDASLGRGSVVARLAGGEIDATIGTQLVRLVEALVPADELVRVLSAEAGDAASAAGGDDLGESGERVDELPPEAARGAAGGGS